MGRRPCCEKVGLKKGPWTADEDKKLINFMLNNAQCCWRALPKLAGLLRCGKSCRLRWTNYLRPDLKRGVLSEDEEKTVIDLHAQLGNRWAKISSHLPGRTDNEIKNYWNTYIKKKLRKMGIDPVTHKPLQPPTVDEDPPQGVAAEQSITVVPAAESTSLQQSTNPEASKYNNSKNDDKVKIKVDPPELYLVNNADFCIDEIPVIEPHEILLSSNQNEKNSPAASSSSSSNSYNSYKNTWLSDGLEDILEFSPSFEVYYDEILKWDNELSLLLDYDTEMSKNNAPVVEESEKVNLL